ncbi:hypothetical protein OG978_47135 (plasmid) [Streptomyces sp. NBC_01591]|uniref:hypothetical protein n=1 Tax=Streptomyces sp. NBC_01591 TaxID=2975888 RepID=UPI002DD95793|nr:hypothetical protein [Streptomyces sp. NBC_01591]WSD66045.1 hypothetical protein OG978_00285 [Streptomyces sp. NBC_01591]WSD73073.1 hypothetical protein OG978_40540 [Streptomyces sp. NBC_01591]WSD73652.1 hypothetical protein OG978_41105 [Streptomyces sp. NBC_01591]WSD74561.1 hypothetical protein OG978_47135 [Streptomyces sp. NBC_01591]
MRSSLFPPSSPSAYPGALTPGEVVIILVVILVAGALALAGLPMFGALEFIAGALYVAVSSLRAMRTTTAPSPEAV